MKLHNHFETFLNEHVNLENAGHEEESIHRQIIGFLKQPDSDQPVKGRLPLRLHLTSSQNRLA